MALPHPQAGDLPEPEAARIHVAVAAPGHWPPLVPQLSLAGEPLHGRDGLFSGIHDPRQH
jgi:hypothetical protein